MLTDIEIAQAASLRPIAEVAAAVGVPEVALEPYGKTKAKVHLDWLAQHRPGKGRPPPQSVSATVFVISERTR